MVSQCWQIDCLDGDSPCQGPCPSQQRVHHGHREVLPLPGVEVILLHGFGHGQPLEQMVDHPENQGERQHWQARVILERRDQRVHPRLLPRFPLWPRIFLLTPHFPFCNDPLASLTDRCARYVMGALCRTAAAKGDDPPLWLMKRAWSLKTSPFRCPEPRTGRTGGYSRLSALQRGLAPLSARLPEEWGWEWWNGVGGAAAALFNHENKEELSKPTLCPSHKFSTNICLCFLPNSNSIICDLSENNCILV